PLLAFAAEVDKYLPKPLWDGAHKLEDFQPEEWVRKFVGGVRESLAATQKTPGVSDRLFIAVDQFEEILVPAAEDPRLSQGLHELLAGVHGLTAENLAWALITLPTDQVQRLSQFAPDHELQIIELAPVGEDDIRDIVEKSLGATGTQTSARIDNPLSL